MTEFGINTGCGGRDFMEYFLYAVGRILVYAIKIIHVVFG